MGVKACGLGGYHQNVEQRLSLGWQLFKVSPTSANDNTLDEAVSFIGDTLFEEISRDAADIWEKVFKEKTEVSHKALSPIVTLLEKLKGMTFVSSHAAPVVELIQAVLSGIPDKGKYIAGVHLFNLQGLVCMLKDKSVLLDHAESLLKARSMDKSISKLIRDFVPVDTAPAVPQANPVYLNSHGLW